MRVAFVATYPPQRGGIASFTHDLAAATGGGEVIALTSPGQQAAYPPEVHHRIRRDEAADYPRIAGGLGRCGIDVVSLQHDFGIWGGADGERVLDFMAALDRPAVATLHRVTGHPTPAQRRIVGGLVGAAAATVVMSRAAATLLRRTYRLQPAVLEIIPHGVPNLPLVDPDSMKGGLGLSGRAVILSFGLLAPGKGHETVLDALPAVLAAVPEAHYVVLGPTHPDELRGEGEAYRRSLLERVERLGLADHVQFDDRFLGRVELGRWLEAADVFVAPRANLDQMVSGAMAYALGAGKPIVATPFPYASEVLARGRGVLVAPGSPSALATALVELLGDPKQRAAMGRRAYRYGRAMIWSTVGASYRQLFERVVARQAPQAQKLRTAWSSTG